MTNDIPEREDEDEEEYLRELFFPSPEELARQEEAQAALLDCLDRDEDNEPAE